MDGCATSEWTRPRPPEAVTMFATQYDSRGSAAIDSAVASRASATLTVPQNPLWRSLAL